MINITTNLDNVYDYSNTIQNYWRNQSGNTAILPNITSFKAVPDEEDKTLIHLTWDAATFENFSHYEIRCSKDWKLDARLGNISNNQVVTDDLTENYLDYRIYNEDDGWAKDISFWIAAYDTRMNRSKDPVNVKLTYCIEPDKVPIVLIEQDKSNKRLVHITWQPIQSSVLDRYVIMVQEEDRKPVFLYVNKDITNFDYYVSHSGILQVAVSAQLESGARIRRPEKAVYNISIAPNRIESLNLSVANMGLTITWEEPLNDDNGNLEYHYVVTKFNLTQEQFKTVAQTSDNNTELINIYASVDGETEQQELDSSVLYSLAQNQGYEVIRELNTKTLKASVDLSGEGLYKVQVFPHRHVWYINKDNKRINKIYEGPSVIQYVYVKS